VRRAAGIAAVGAILVVNAYVFEAAILYVPGLAFVFIGLLTPGWVWVAARGTTVTRVLHVDRVVEDQPLEATLELRRGILGMAGVELLDPLAGEVITLGPSVAPLRAGRVTRARIMARFSRRGRRRFDAPALAFTDPLGLMRVVRQSSAPAEELLVLPRTERVRWLRRDAGARVDSAAARAAMEAMAATEVDGLRPYRPGTPASRISWPALARGAGLLERRLRADREGGPLVVLDTRSSGSSAEVDDAVRAAASLTLELARKGGCDLMLPGDRRPAQIGPDLAAWPGTHTRLALIEGGPGAPIPALGTGARISQLFYVAADSKLVPDSVLRGERGAVVLVLPAPQAPAAAHQLTFEVSGCRGFVVGVAAGRWRPRERAA
jgi:uncharacterized protein (DUF58 family)